MHRFLPFLFLTTILLTFCMSLPVGTGTGAAPVPGATKSSSSGTGSGPATPYTITLSSTQYDYIYRAKFSVELVTNINVQQSASITLDGIDPAWYSNSLSQIDQLTYQIEFTISHTIPITTLQFSYIPGISIGGLSATTEWYAELTTKQMLYLTSGQIQASQTMEVIGQTATIAMGAISGSLVILAGNPAIMWALVTMLQMFYYLIFIRVNYPYNVQIVLEVFAVGGLDFIPNPITLMDPEIEEETVPTPEKFEEYGVPGLFLANAGNMLLVWTATLVVYGLALLGKIFLKRAPEKVKNLFAKIVRWFEWSGVLRALIASYMDVIQAAFLQLRATSFESVTLGVSSMFGIVFAVFGVVFPIFALMIVKHFSKKPAFLTQKYGAFVEEYDLDKTYPKYFTVYSLTQRLLLILTLVFLHNYPSLQVSCLTALGIITALLHIIFRPYPSRMENICSIVSEFFFTAIYALILALVYDDERASFSDDTRVNLGWSIIASCGVIVLISLGKALVEQVNAIRELIQVVKRYLNKKQKVEDISIEEGKKVVDSSKSHIDSSVELVTNLSLSSNATSLDMSMYFQRPKHKRVKPRYTSQDSQKQYK